ncbi:MAG TPA: sporulation histidine kinase inhibitor Sda [Bacillota bacterium]|nr:sporulation histidine kinase inhibitor Sda [Bacillota bacterium]
MFWETTVSDYLLVEMFKTAVLNDLDPEFTQVMYDEIQKRKLKVDLNETEDPSTQIEIPNHH